MGWLSRAHSEIEMSLASVFGNARLGAWAEEFMGFLTERECKNSTMACAICDHRTRKLRQPLLTRRVISQELP
jgi:hypothetical protein